jgi:mannitol/fructose-specific phosphotransferase system IIA component (Ntr-type)
MQLLKDTYTDLYFIDSDSKTKEEVLKKIVKYVERPLRTNPKSLYDHLMKLDRHETLDGVIIMELRLSGLGRPFALVLCKTLNPIDFGFPDSKAINCVLLHLNYRQTDPAQLLPMVNMVSLIKNDEYRKKLLEARSDNAMVAVFRLFDIHKDKMRENK